MAPTSPRDAPVAPIADVREWLEQPGPHRLVELDELLGPRSSAAGIALLMLTPALPLPTGGISHVMEVLAALLCLRLAAGKRELWLPRRWRDIELSARGLRRLTRALAFLERMSRPRWSAAMEREVTVRTVALGMLVLSAAAFVAPPFSGLDTLPSIGVVLLAMSLLLTDALYVVIGIVAGATGILLEFALGAALWRSLGL